MVHRRTPYRGVPPDVVLDTVARRGFGEELPPVGPLCPAALRDLIGRCVQYAAEKYGFCFSSIFICDVFFLYGLCVFFIAVLPIFVFVQASVDDRSYL